jgi:hypothetical protein
MLLTSRNVTAISPFICDGFQTYFESEIFYCSEILLINYKGSAVNEFEQHFYENFRY